MNSTDSPYGTGGPDTTRGPGSPFRQEPTPRDEAPQFVLPLVVRIEKNAPPSRTDALETAARAVVVMLSDERSSGDGEWAGRVRDWQDGRIRKVVRRARGAEWRKASELPGITVTGSGAEVRVFPPVPLDGWPRELSKLQVSGTELVDPEGAEDGADTEGEEGTEVSGETGEPGQPGGPAGDVGPGRALIWLNPELRMSTGKEMAQVGHGAQLLWWDMDEEERASWREAGFPLAVRTAAAGRWAELAASGLPTVRDAGFTEIAPGSVTVVADHPVRD
ncbi:peptidyl-tRNA hydrolase [Streptomyces wuyuanensis]|uniref:peptidyl-tRNA hydrolase n=1 Tax=Streptomyces wuyuanensis TaxID=1196353 RepID=A0A1G9MSF1_9ACTN|nr:peptidyl-tRNA hydrolase [Streptomyces wuyuanensis]SDL77034.1 Peptidyl-tRNA hydrolase [Streptomyces wuyuanensis]